MIGKGILILFAILVVVVIPAIVITTNVHVNQKVGGWYSQAIASADAEQLYDFTERTLAGLRELDLTTGYHALVYKTPDNDMAVEYEIIEGCAQRALEIQKYPVGSMDYAKSLDDVRQQLRAVNIGPTYGYLIKHNAWILYFGVLGFWVIPLGLGILLWKTPHREKVYIRKKPDEIGDLHNVWRWWW